MSKNLKNIHWVCPRCGGHCSAPKGELPDIDGKCDCGGTYVETRYTEGEIYNDFRNGDSTLVDKIKEEYVFSNEQYNPEEYQKWQDKRAGKEPFHSTYNQPNTPKCPTCGSTNIKKIGNLERGASVGLFGLFSSKIGKTMQCKNCGYKW